MSQRMLLVGLVLALVRTTAAGAQSNIIPPPSAPVVSTQIIPFSFVLAGKVYQGVLQQQGRVELDDDFDESRGFRVVIHVAIVFRWSNVLTVTPGNGATYVARPLVGHLSRELTLESQPSSRLRRGRRRRV